MQPMLNIALRAARSAGELIYRSMERLDVLTVNEKEANDYVSEIDRAAEQTIITHLRKTYPDHGFHAEESGFQPGQGEGADIVCIIDPLDGTTNFLRGVPHFAVSIACRIKGRIEHAVILDPVRQEEFTASRGRGAALNGKRLRVRTARAWTAPCWVPASRSSRTRSTIWTTIWGCSAAWSARRPASAAVALPAWIWPTLPPAAMTPSGNSVWPNGTWPPVACSFRRRAA